MNPIFNFSYNRKYDMNIIYIFELAIQFMKLIDPPDLYKKKFDFCDNRRCYEEDHPVVEL